MRKWPIKEAQAFHVCSEDEIPSVSHSKLESVEFENVYRHSTLDRRRVDGKRSEHLAESSQLPRNDLDRLFAKLFRMDAVDDVPLCAL